MVCLFSHGSSLVIQSITFSSLRTFINAEDPVHHIVPAHGIISHRCLFNPPALRILQYQNVSTALIIKNVALLS